MRSVVAMTCVLSALMAAGPAGAAGCPGNPDALGTSRTLVVDPAEHPLLGGFQYRESLPLNDKEVVITFDDGPLPPYSTRILDILAQECVKATYFMVGKMVRTFPKIVRRTYEEGHTIANHSQSHPFNFHRMTVEQAAQEIEAGFESLRAVLGDSAKDVAPFFRFPGLLRQDSVEHYLTSRKVMSWSVDFMADDWRRISASEIVRRALMRLESKGKGILLLHDIQPATALGLPTLLRELKQRGYRVVHVVPVSADRVKTATLPAQWVVRHAPVPKQDGIWPRVVAVKGLALEPVLDAPSLRSFGAADESISGIPVTLGARAAVLRSDDGAIPLPVRAMWPRTLPPAATQETVHLPIPAMENFRYIRQWKSRTTVGKHKRRAARATTNTPTAKEALIGAKDAAPQSKRTKTKRRTKTKTRDVSKPGGEQRSGHQIQLPKPTATLWSTVTQALSR